MDFFQFVCQVFLGFSGFGEVVVDVGDEVL